MLCASAGIRGPGVHDITCHRRCPFAPYRLKCSPHLDAALFKSQHALQTAVLHSFAVFATCTSRSGSYTPSSRAPGTWASGSSCAGAWCSCAVCTSTRCMRLCTQVREGLHAAFAMWRFPLLVARMEMHMHGYKGAAPSRGWVLCVMARHNGLCSPGTVGCFMCSMQPHGL